MMLRKKHKPDALDSLMSGSDEYGDDEAMAAEPSMAVIAVEDEDDDMEPEEGTPDAAIAKIRSSLDELERMFRQG